MQQLSPALIIRFLLLGALIFQLPLVGVLHAENSTISDRFSYLREAADIRITEPERAEAMLKNIINTSPLLDELVGVAYDFLGKIYYNRRDFTDARIAFARSLDILRDVRSTDMLQVAYVMGDLGAALREEGRADKARPYVERSIEIRRALLARDNPKLLAGLENLGLVYTNIPEKVEDAKNLFSEIWHIKWDLGFTETVFAWCSYFALCVTFTIWLEAWDTSKRIIQAILNVGLYFFNHGYYAASGLAGSYLIARYGTDFLKLSLEQVNSSSFIWITRLSAFPIGLLAKILLWFATNLGRQFFKLPLKPLFNKRP